MSRHRMRLPVGLALVVLLALVLAQAVPAALAGSPVGSEGPTAASRVFVPLIGSNFSFGGPPASGTRFWADRYSLDSGGCTTLHWKTSGAQSVTLEDKPVAASGTQEECPGGFGQFYRLAVTDASGNMESFELTTWAGEQGLLPTEVIAQAAVQSVSALLVDVDPTTPGNQYGYSLQLSNVSRLYSADAGWNQTSVTLAVPQSLIDAGFNGPVHWPVKAGQLVEFRANCDGATCQVVDAGSYLYLRSE